MSEPALARSTYLPSHAKLGAISYRLTLPLCRALGRAVKFYSPASGYARERGQALQTKLRRGEPVYLLGIGPAGHNTGVALVEVSSDSGIRLLCNNEEERFTGIKHCVKFPELALEELLQQMKGWGIKPEQIHACLASWDYTALSATLLRSLVDEFPASLVCLDPKLSPVLNVTHLFEILHASKRLGQQLGTSTSMPIIGMRHHDNHAYFSYAVSPFASSRETVMIAVLDGLGDDGAISLYSAKDGKLALLYHNDNIFDSLGAFYSVLSSTQGGWTMLSSEGRYMGAAAWGNSDRRTNPYYQQLRELFYFHTNGKLYLNRSLANWQRKYLAEPYTRALTEILGPPIDLKSMWNPDAVLNVENLQHPEVTQERLDKAAAVQLVFEDALFHIIGNLIRSTGSSRLVFTGGTALNCTANMQLLEQFDEEYYERYLGMKQTRLHLWIPPVPSDTGVPPGAAYHFALANGASIGSRLSHAFYCGTAPTGDAIRAAMEADSDICHMYVGNRTEPESLLKIADLMAYITEQNGIIGIYQGVAETGPRALGHRSILANPCNPQTREILNNLVKYREAIRPLAPMATPDAAQRWFCLSPGASDDDYNAYNYMVLTVRARPESHPVIPAVIHRDGTGRLQIVREETDPLLYAYLKALGRRIGVEIAVNTSLNVGGPIVQTPVQAIQTLKRSKGMDGILMVSDEGDVFLVWHGLTAPPKDGGKRLQGWVDTWKMETQMVEGIASPTGYIPERYGK
jgi:carbamoyltransferase